MSARPPSQPRLRSGEYRSPAFRAASRGRLLGPRLAVLFLGGCVLFGYPILGLFATPASVGGVPALYLYLFLAWAGFIAAIAALVEAGSSATGTRREEPP